MLRTGSVTGTVLNGLLSVTRSRESSRACGREPSGLGLETFLERVRSYDFSGHSDTSLRKTLFDLKERPVASETAAYVFAVVAETIDRRLGMWRVFDGPFTRFNGPPYIGLDQSAVSDALSRVSEERKYRRLSEIHLPAAFYSAIRRHGSDTGLRFQVTDEQLLAGLHMFHGRVVQMNAGEGKTVAAAFPAVLHALLGRLVHLVTANDYLAARDAELLLPVYESLGISSGAVFGQMEDAERRYAYRNQIVYGTMREFGFDYLRDNLKVNPDDRVQGNLQAAIIDEVDHALIDEAFTPMIISGNPIEVARPVGKVKGAVSALIDAQHIRAKSLAERASGQDVREGVRLELMARLMLAQPEDSTLQDLLAVAPSRARRVRALAGDDHSGLTIGLLYAVDPDLRFVTLTEEGWEFLEKQLGRIYDRWRSAEYSAPPDVGDRMPIAERRKRAVNLSRRVARQYALGNYVYQMLRAFLLLKRGVDYVVDDDAIVLIDRHTGRPKTDSVYQFSLHSALEAKEGVTLRQEFDTLGQISVAGFIALYDHVSGMTGTAAVSAGEFDQKYGLDVVVVPPSNAMMRVDLGPRVYLTGEEKLRALVDEVVRRHWAGQPVLVGTGTVRQSEELSRRLAERGIPHNLLNAVATHQEAQIVRDAGRFEAVTVATNMAGRGTDILLEPGLNARITRRYVGLIEELAARDAGDVVVSCRSPGQAQSLREELDLALSLDTACDGREVRVSLKGRHGAGVGEVKTEFSLGLCVIAAEMHDSTRVHLQFNGRSGRQGEFGETVSFLSLEDRLLNLRAGEILRLSRRLGVDAIGREYFSGDAVANLVAGLRRDSEREGEAQRGLMQDYFAVPDLQTRLFYRRRQQVIGSSRIRDKCREIAFLQASGLVNRYLDRSTHDLYSRQFGRLAEEAALDYGVNCSDLYGCALDILPEEIGRILAGKLDESSACAGPGLFEETARLLYLQTSDGLWREHLTRLRDSMSNHILGARSHKSAVAAYVRYSSRAWDEFWEQVDSEFLVKLAAFPFSSPGLELERPTPASEQSVSEQVEMLLAELPRPAVPPAVLMEAAARSD